MSDAPWFSVGGEGAAVTAHTSSDRPDLWARAIRLPTVWPEYNLHGETVNYWWPQLDEEFPDFQFLLYDQADDTVLAVGITGPLAWDGRDESLPDGIDAVLEVIFGQRRQGRLGQQANTVCALAAEIQPGGRSRGLAAEMLAAMRANALRHGLTRLIAPVRPSWKARYPLAPIERYVQWRREDGRLLDPWMRTHERLGARVGAPLPRSLRIDGTVADWESWVGMPFPESGDYVFPEGLATVHIDREADLGSYWEPNVWMIHPEV
jgi:hypothetical protein